MNPSWQRAQELQRAIDAERQQGGGGRLPWLYLALGRAREQLASESLSNGHAQGWVDRLAAITAYARAGASVRARQLWATSRAQASGWPSGGALLAQQHGELEVFLRERALEPVGISLPGATSSNDVDHILRLARAHWPDGMMDASNSRAARRLDAALKGRWSPPVDFTLHETMATFDSWTARGPIEAGDAQGMLVVVESDRVRFVADERAPQARSLAEDMAAALKKNRWLANAARWPVSAPQEAA